MGTFLRASNRMNWKSLATLSRVCARRRIGEEKRFEDRYPIAHIPGAKQILWAARSHWCSQNELHWTVDMALAEEPCRGRKDHGPENLACCGRSH